MEWDSRVKRLQNPSLPRLAVQPQAASHPLCLGLPISRKESGLNSPKGSPHTGALGISAAQLSGSGLDGLGRSPAPLPTICKFSVK